MAGLATDAAEVEDGPEAEVEVLPGSPAARATGALVKRRDRSVNALNKLARVRISRPTKGANIITGSCDFKITEHLSGLTSGLRPLPRIIVACYLRT